MERVQEKSKMGKETIYDIKIKDEQQGARIDQALSFALPELSRSFVQKLIQQGAVEVDGVICASKKTQVTPGQKIKVTVPEPEGLDVVPEDIPLDIVYEDQDVLVVNKPKGMVVHPAAGNHSGTLVNAILHHCGEELSSINGVVRPGIVHRIDKDTSGLLMIAKNDMAHRSLAEQLERHTIERAYRAVVYNNFTQDEGTIDAPIGRDPRNRLRQAVTETHSKRAVTHYQVLERFGTFTHIEARLETGRTHQIRVHMAHIKHPLLGDSVYGPGKNAFGAEGQVLHAKVLGFQHPRSGQHMVFESPLPDQFEKILKKMRERK